MEVYKMKTENPIPQTVGLESDKRIIEEIERIERERIEKGLTVSKQDNFVKITDYLLEDEYVK